MLRLLELCALAFVAGMPTAVALRVTEPAPTAAMAQTQARADRFAALSAAKPALALARTPTVIERADDGMFYIEGRINGAPVRFLIDTGASVVVLTGKDAAAAGLAGAPAASGTALRTVSGPVGTRWTRLDLDLAGRKLPDLETAVIGAGPGVSLLGQNALAAFGSITIEHDRLVLR